jgi:hypothetical protein
MPSPNMKAFLWVKLVFLATVIQFTGLTTSGSIFVAAAADQVGNWTDSVGAAAPPSTEQRTVEFGHQSKSGSTAPTFCRTIVQRPGEYCSALAQRCGLSLNDFQRFNPPANFCNNLVEGQMVCCNEGGLPRPQRGPDGLCAVYTIQEGEGCGKIAAKNGLTQSELDSFNTGTWGWLGCRNSNKFYPNTKICVSPGEPPFPAEDKNAECGPTKPGTRRPSGIISTEWGTLSPCPLKACCNNWGRCGISEEFCVSASLGAPGTSSKQNGCVGNCGMSIINNRVAPQQFRHVGYFEAWNQNRKCLHMDVTEIPKVPYTHIHFSFPEITPDYEVKMGPLQKQFDKFIRIQGGPKKIVAFGGWAFSTELATHGIFRNGVKPGNREKLASNLAKFVLQNKLDGIDFDWEYPGVPDMNWLPPSSPDEAPNYAAFLKLMRRKLPDQSISIAAPASFWYLKAFPIEEIAKTIDYIVYMTYDL